ncbi:hypothetical protein PAI11_06700 [Patulibacter medicamentivorans]|uniref:Uncharacterized protein n=1 Tax=Patulibacter medicamentivorans TaxID=1097667 RepID=H0E1K8_9ACTN|nr:hypothetical protein PAI11_06700 [Patulibacter medicamentivorans]
MAQAPQVDAVADQALTDGTPQRGGSQLGRQIGEGPCGVGRQQASAVTDGRDGSLGVMDPNAGSRAPSGAGDRDLDDSRRPGKQPEEESGGDVADGMRDAERQVGRPGAGGEPRLHRTDDVDAPVAPRQLAVRGETRGRSGAEAGRVKLRQADEAGLRLGGPAEPVPAVGGGGHGCSLARRSPGSSGWHRIGTKLTYPRHASSPMRNRSA